jgi:hypothetical protein
MFGTLVIVLPSRHRKRGPSSSCWQIQGIPYIQVLRVRDGLYGVVGPHVRFGYSSPHCPFNRFSGVYHEVKPVLSGHRLALTYNLIHGSLSPQVIRLAPTDTVLSRLKTLLTRWRNYMDTNYFPLPTDLAFLLEYQYNESSLSFNGLMGRDQTIVQYIRAASEECGICLYLANIERKLSGDCQPSDGDGLESMVHSDLERTHEIVNANPRECC